jgi:hypothetical protein
LEQAQQAVTTKSPQISFADLAVYSQKTKSDLSQTSSNAYFSINIIPNGNSSYNVEVTMNGDNSSIVYSSDLVMEFDPKAVQISDIKNGQVFPLYPRAVINNNQIVITGTSKINPEGISFGKPGSVFATFKVHKVSSQKSTILVLNDRSDAYYQTQDMLDKAKSVASFQI